MGLAGNVRTIFPNSAMARIPDGIAGHQCQIAELLLQSPDLPPAGLEDWTPTFFIFSSNEPTATDFHTIQLTIVPFVRSAYLDCLREWALSMFVSNGTASSTRSILTPYSWRTNISGLSFVTKIFGGMVNSKIWLLTNYQGCGRFQGTSLLEDPRSN